METGSLLAVVVFYVIGLAILFAIIRSAVRRGIEDVIYKKGKDGKWGAHPWLLSIADEIRDELEASRQQGPSS